MYNGRAAPSCSTNLFPTENYFTAATKRVISSMQSFTKKISGRKGKDSAEIFPSSEYWWTLHLKFDPALKTKLYRCMQILHCRLTPICLPICCCLATFPLSDVIHTLFFTVARQHYAHLQRYMYIYIYMHPREKRRILKHDYQRRCIRRLFSALRKGNMGQLQAGCNSLDWLKTQRRLKLRQLIINLSWPINLRLYVNFACVLKLSKWAACL